MPSCLASSLRASSSGSPRGPCAAGASTTSARGRTEQCRGRIASSHSASACLRSQADAPRAPTRPLELRRRRPLSRRGDALRPFRTGPRCRHAGHTKGLRERHRHHPRKHTLCELLPPPERSASTCSGQRAKDSLCRAAHASSKRRGETCGRSDTYTAAGPAPGASIII